MMDLELTCEKPAAFGTLLGTASIAGTAIEVFANGPNATGEQAHSTDSLGRYLGLKYQCVELVRRFVWLHHGINLALLWREGNAEDWNANADIMNLRRIAPAQARTGDIVTFTGGPHGHIALVSATSVSAAGPNGFTIAQQNLFNDARDLAVDLGPAILAGNATLAGRDGNCYSFQSFLRVGDA